MEKKHIVKFLETKNKRGVYTLIAELYADVVTSMTTTMALEVIREDLERDCGQKVELNYFSLAQAVARLRKKKGPKSPGEKGKWQFRDASEMPEADRRPGKFNLD